MPSKWGSNIFFHFTLLLLWMVAQFGWLSLRMVAPLGLVLSWQCAPQQKMEGDAMQVGGRGIYFHFLRICIWLSFLLPLCAVLGWRWGKSKDGLQ